MAIRIVEIHPAKDKKQLNAEWFVVENIGDAPFTSKNCSVESGKGSGRSRSLGTMDPGFAIGPGEKVRVITGNPGKTAHGKPVADDVKNYHLFLAAGWYKGPGTVLSVKLRSHELARAVFDPSAAGGVAGDD